MLVYPAVELLGHMVVLYLTFWGTPGTVLTYATMSTTIYVVLSHRTLYKNGSVL